MPCLDLPVIGAGPAGSVRATSALAAFDRLRVALVDKDSCPRDLENYARYWSENFESDMQACQQLRARVRFQKFFMQAAFRLRPATGRRKLSPALRAPGPESA